jgi:Uma2 family endonuclease
MSTLDRPKRKTLLPLAAGEHLDQPAFHERYEAMPPSTRAELVGGVVYMPSPMQQDHCDESRIVAGWLDSYQRLTPGVEGGDGGTIKLDPRGEPQPDHHLRIPTTHGGRCGVDAKGYLTGAPELIVEIARSSGHYDLGKKKADYQRTGADEYLVVELDPHRIHWFVRRGGRFEELPPGPDGLYRSEVFPGLWLDPDALFNRDRERLYRVLRRGARSPEHAAFAARLAPQRGRRKTR